MKKLNIVHSPSSKVEVNVHEDIYCHPEKAYILPEGLLLEDTVSAKEHYGMIDKINNSFIERVKVLLFGVKK